LALFHAVARLATGSRESCALSHGLERKQRSLDPLHYRLALTCADGFTQRGASSLLAQVGLHFVEVLDLAHDPDRTARCRGFQSFKELPPHVCPTTRQANIFPTTIGKRSIGRIAVALNRSLEIHRYDVLQAHRRMKKHVSIWTAARPKVTLSSSSKAWLQRTAASHHCCNPRVPWAGSLGRCLGACETHSAPFVSFRVRVVSHRWYGYRFGRLSDAGLLFRSFCVRSYCGGVCFKKK
jgi:hypothetical protein